MDEAGAVHFSQAPMHKKYLKMQFFLFFRRQPDFLPRVHVPQPHVGRRLPAVPPSGPGAGGRQAGLRACADAVDGVAGGQGAEEREWVADVGGGGGVDDPLFQRPNLDLASEAASHQAGWSRVQVGNYSAE